MRTFAPISLLAVLVAAFGLPAASVAVAGPPKLTELSESYLFTPSGKVTPLRAGVGYQASRSQPALRLTPPDAGRSGAQWKGGTDYFQGGGPPNFGWVALVRGSAKGIPHGMVTIMTAYGRTPSVAATVNVLRTRGCGATYEATAEAKLGGFSGIQFDGQIVGAKNHDHNGHYFIPFSPPSHTAKYYPDEYRVYGDVFRVIVLDVRAKTVVVYIENVALPVEQYPAFLGKAEQLLRSLRFPTATKGG